MAIQRDKIIASAEKLVAKGKVEAAIKEYERLLEDNPNDVNTLNRIGDLWVRINRNDEAVKVFGKIADHYSRDGFFLKAIAIYKKINKLDPSKLDVYAKLADLYAKQGLAMEAKSQYQVLADYYLKHGDPLNALATYRKISELDPNSINVHVKLADLYSQNNQTAEALKEYDRVGRMLLKRGMLDEAVQVFRKALKIDASNIELIESLVNALLDARDFDNARQILETSLERNKENPRLIMLLGKSQLGRSDLGAARTTLENGLSSNPTDTSIREVLAEVYLRQGEATRALDLVNPVIDAALGRADGKTAVDLLGRILKVEPGNIPTLTRLVAVYTRLREETNILSAMNLLAEAQVAARNFGEAANVLGELVRREPDNRQHRDKLAFVRQQLGSGDAPPASPQPGAPTTPPKAATPTAAATPAQPKASPAPAPPAPTSDFDLGEEELTISLDDSEPVDLDLSAEVESAPSVGPVDTYPSYEIESVAASSELEDPEVENLDFITEHMTEAEVFAKYGLTEKAVEHLRSVLDRAPRHLPAYDRLLRVYMEEGDSTQVQQVANRYLSLLRETGDDATRESLQQELVARGFSDEGLSEAPISREVSEPVSDLIDVDEISPSVGDFLSSGVAPTPEELSIDMSIDSTDEIEFDVEEPPDFELPPVAATPPEAAEEEKTVQPLPEETFSLDEVEIVEPSHSAAASPEIASETEALPDFSISDLGPSEFELERDNAAAAGPELSFLKDEPETELPETEVEAEQEASTPAPTLEPAAGPEISFDSDAFSLGESATLPSAEEMGFDPEATVYAGAVSPLEETTGFESLVTPAGPPPEELGEIDFYIEQDLVDEARSRLETLEARFPGHEEVRRRQHTLDERSAAAAPVVEPASIGFSKDDIENELLSAMPEDDDIEIIGAPKAMAQPQPEDEGNLFAEEDDFFDLAAELEDELEEDNEETVSLSEEEQSLEEIFKEFKRGVEQQLDSEDYDTHYNLGIAYKEMGLIDEAIGEFQLASKDPKRAIECCSMLGLCFLEKGMPQLAIKWYTKGLEVAEINQDEQLGLLYDLGSAYLEVGDVPQAQKAFIEIYGVNSNYRDIVERIRQIGEMVGDGGSPVTP